MFDASETLRATALECQERHRFERGDHHAAVSRACPNCIEEAIRAAHEAGRAIVLQLCATLTLADHLGDVASSIETALRRIGADVGRWDDLHELADRFGERGITTLYGTSMAKDTEPGKEGG